MGDTKITLSANFFYPIPYKMILNQLFASSWLDCIHEKLLTHPLAPSLLAGRGATALLFYLSKKNQFHRHLIRHIKLLLSRREGFGVG